MGEAGITARSRWLDVERITKVLSKTSCPAATARKVTNWKVDSKIANAIDYKMRGSASEGAARPGVVDTNALYAQPPRSAAKAESQHLLAEFSVAFRDHCRCTPHSNKKSIAYSTPPVFVQSQELLQIFRQVEENCGAPVVNVARLKKWIVRTGE